MEGGCGNKASLSFLKEALSPSGLFIDEGDAGEFAVDNLTFTQTIDTALLFGEDLSFFARVAFLHALGDTTASRAIGLSATVSVCLPHPNASQIREIMLALRGVASEHGIKITKGHTRIGGELSLTISILGRKLPGKPIRSGVELCVFQTRPLGAYFSYLTAGDRTGDAAAMGISHTRLIEETSSLPVEFTDVSGFGLGGALCVLAERCQVNIELSYLWYSESDGMLPYGCFTERNFTDFEKSITPMLVEKHPRIMFFPEFSGPLIAVLEQEHSYDFRNRAALAGFKVRQIGFSKGRTAEGPWITFNPI